MILRKNLIHFFENVFLNGIIKNFIVRIKDKTATVNFRNLAGDVRGLIYLKKIEVQDCDLYFKPNLIHGSKSLFALKPLETEFIKFIPVMDEILNSYTKIDFEEVDSNRHAKCTISLGQLEYFDLDEKVCKIKNYDLIIDLDTNQVLEIFNVLQATSDKGKKNYLIFFKRDDDYITFESFAIDGSGCSLPMNDFIVTDNKKITVFEYFDTLAFKQIFESNKGKFDAASIKLSSKGIMEISFSNEYMESTYWLLGNRERIHQAKKS